MKNVSGKLVAQLVLFHVIVIALANYLVQFTDTFLDYTFTWAMFIFPVVILATDLTVRLSNQYNARLIVGIAYIPAILISAWLADWRIGIASGTAYLVGQLVDIWIFQGIRERSKSWWTAPLISTFFANIIDTYVFYSSAFYRSVDDFMASNWVEIATIDLVFKIVVSILLFLPIYGLVLNFVQKNFTVSPHNSL